MAGASAGASAHATSSLATAAETVGGWKDPLASCAVGSIWPSTSVSSLRDTGCVARNLQVKLLFAYFSEVSLLHLLAAAGMKARRHTVVGVGRSHCPGL